MSEPVTVNETGISLVPDQTRVITRFFVPGREDVGPGDSRAGPVIERILELDEARCRGRDARHRRALLRPASRPARHVRRACRSGRVPTGPGSVPSREATAARSARRSRTSTPSKVRRCATRPPSSIPTSPTNGDAAFVLSVRGIGEGHRSSIGFRTGAVTADGHRHPRPSRALPSNRCAVTGQPSPAVVQRQTRRARRRPRERLLRARLTLRDRFDDADAHRPDRRPGRRRGDRRHTATTIAHLRDVARSSYRVDFPPSTELSERVLWPHAPAERHGMEDARFVRFVDETVNPRTTPPTPRSTARTSPSTSSRPPTSRRSPCRRWPAPPPPARDWRCFPVASTGATSRCREPIARPTRWQCPTICGAGTRRRTIQTPDLAVGGPPTRQLRITDRDPGRLARPHPRCRPDAHLLARRHPPRPRRASPSARPLRRTDPRPGRESSAMATSPTSCTRAAGSRTATSSYSPTESATRASRSRPSPSISSWAPFAPLLGRPDTPQGQRPGKGRSLTHAARRGWQPSWHGPGSCTAECAQVLSPVQLGPFAWGPDVLRGRSVVVGTVAERTIAPALKAGGPQGSGVRIPPVPLVEQGRRG